MQHFVHPWVDDAREAVARVGGLVGQVDLRDRLGLSKQRVSVLVNTELFPDPFATVDGRPVWLGQDVDMWALLHASSETADSA